MEYRAWITIPGLALEREDRWEPFIERMERDHADDLGPTLGWDTPDLAYVVLSVEGRSRSAAAATMVEAITETLQAVGLDDLAPTAIRFEGAAPAEPVAA